MDAIINFYILQIKMRKITLEKIPEKYKEKVKEKLEESEKALF